MQLDSIKIIYIEEIRSLIRWRVFCTLLAMICFLIVPHGSAANSSSNTYDSGFDHGCDDAGIANPSDRVISQPDNGSKFHTQEFMAGYYDGFNECSVGGNNIRGDGNVTLPAECGMRALDDDQLFQQQLSEHQCFFFNSCKNLGGSIPGCYEEARNINCNIEHGNRINCPIVLLDK